MRENKRPMATRSYEERSRYTRDDVKDTREPDGTGGYNEVRRYSDGSSTYKYGMCGNISYNEYGEEI